MKVLVVLALAAFTGCHAGIVREKQPKQPVDMVKDAFWDWVAKATATAEDSLQQIKASQLGEEVNTLISESTDTVNKLADALRSQVAPLTSELVSKFSQEAKSLQMRLENDLTAVGTRLHPFAETMLADLQTQLEGLKGMAPANTMDPEALKTALLQKSKGLKEQLDDGVKKMQAEMIPYTEEVREKVEKSLDEFQKSVTPMLQSFETKLTQKTQEIQQRLVPIGEELKANLDADSQNLKKRLTALWTTFTDLTQ
ncbi:apolipoprotein A-I-like [Brachionichthys hirsutus]|uniref:apolipoprotein A-I-like n=1 Tax=Brachionichthys hirsutus TaxID=412623 RepID=UPI0036046DB3